MKLHMIAATIQLVLITNSLVAVDPEPGYDERRFHMLPSITASLTGRVTENLIGGVSRPTQIEQPENDLVGSTLKATKDPLSQLIHDRARFLFGGAMMLSGIIIMMLGGKMMVDSLNPRTSTQ